MAKSKKTLRNALLKKIETEYSRLKIRNLRFIDRGWDHYVVIINKRLVLRFPKKISQKSLLEFQDEIRLLAYLKTRLKTGIPSYCRIARDKTFAGYKILTGQELTRARFHRLTSRERSILALQLADFLTHLHNTPKSAIKKYRIRADKFEEGHKHFVRKVRKFLYPRLSRRKIKLINEYLIELEASLKHQFSRTLIHDDLTGEHILWDGTKKHINIVDFSDRNLGDPASDFAGLFEYGFNFAREVFGLYKAKKDPFLLSRALLYYKRIALYLMIEALEGYPTTYKYGYKLFKQRFKR